MANKYIKTCSISLGKWKDFSHAGFKEHLASTQQGYCQCVFCLKTH
jgi:hypothetical protein